MSETAAAELRHASNQRWVVLGAGLAAQAASCVFLYGLPAIVPTLRSRGAISHHGLTLGAVGVLVAAPSVGLLLTLILWGAAADRFGERVVISIGLALATAALVAAATVHGFVALGLVLVVAGAAGASVNAASGRMVIGWFAAKQRGLAMGIRQTGQPLGVALAAAILPPVAARWGVTGAFIAMASLCAVATVVVMLLAADPPRPAVVAGAPRARSPYRDGVLWRIHAASAGAGRAPVRGVRVHAGLPGVRTRLVADRGGAVDRRLPGRGRRGSRSWPGSGRTGWAVGCARCGRWPWPARR